MTTRHSRGRDATARSGTELSAATTELARDIAAFWDSAAMSGQALFEGWLKLVGAPFDAAMRRVVPSIEDLPADGERRADALPWVPKFDTGVVPLRRADDPEGAEASRITMRMAVPGVFGAGVCTNVVSIDTLVPRPASAAESERPAHPAMHQRAAG